MDRYMTRDHWLSLGLERTAQSEYEAGAMRTIEAAGAAVVGVPSTAPGTKRWAPPCAGRRRL